MEVVDFFQVLFLQRADIVYILSVIVMTFAIRKALPVVWSDKINQIQGKWPTAAVGVLLGILFSFGEDVITNEVIIKYVLSLGLSIILYDYVIKVIEDKIKGKSAVKKEDAV